MHADILCLGHEGPALLLLHPLVAGDIEEKVAPVRDENGVIEIEVGLSAHDGMDLLG